ncbi:MAG TPA: response regulator [Methylomirabilota bacterium]|nr:response regulator [Methylomirabilota bacterium]
MDRRLKVLLLEDVASDAELIERELQRSGLDFTSLRVETREQFIDALDRATPDIILADYTLPQFSALDALQLLRERGCRSPLILVTGSNSEEIAVECMKEGAEDYILKSSLKRLPSAVRRSYQKLEAERERAAAAQAARRSEEQYRLITENTRDLICLLDTQCAFLFASPSHRLVLGREPDEIIGTAFTSWLHPEDRHLFEETFDEAMFFRESRTAELRFQHANGSWQQFESAVSHIFRADGKPERVLVVSRDTSDRKRAEREIRKLAAFPRYNPNPVLEFAADGSLTYFNDAAMEMARSLKKNHPQAILPLNVAAIVTMALSSGQNKLRHQTSIEGRVLSWSFFPIVANQVVHCYAEDITASVNLEAQLRQVQKMESVGQLAAGVAHDFNNILTVIQGHSTLLASDPSLDPAKAASARQIALAAERAANLTRQLLMFSRKQIMQPQLLNLNEVVSNVYKMLRVMVGPSVNLRRELTPDLPAVHADPGMLEQVLVNLAVNARDAMPNGGDLTIGTRCVAIDETYAAAHPEARLGYFVCLSVTDTGHGMDAATKARIFEPFFTTKEVGKGTGLGLATIYGIVKQHEGWIEVESEVGEGTEFRIFLAASCHASRSSSLEKPQDVPGGDETILVVEDEPALRELVQEILEKKGYRVIEASTGVQALQLWDRHKDEIDLLLTDMMMPEGVSGRELADRILADRSDLKVIYSSGYSLDVVNPGFAVREGLTFLQKPYDPETLAKAVRDCLNQSRQP